MPQRAPHVDRILERVADYSPSLRGFDDRFHAATALVLTREATPRMVVIRRASRHGDPWSGHAALPGGRYEATDPDLATTAARETAEEVGVSVADPVGRLDDIGGRTRPGVVSPFVFVVDHPTELVPEPSEVAAAHWIPLDVMIDPAHRTRHPSRRVGPWPAWSWRTGMAPPHDELVIWGLTHRTLTNFLEVAGLQ